MSADVIRSRRAALGLTQAGLAAKARIDTKTVSRAEAGHRMSADTLTALAQALELPITELTQAADRNDAVAEDRPLPVIRSGKASDQTDHIAVAQFLFREMADIELIVLPDQKPRHRPSAIVIATAAGFTCGFTPMILAACYAAGLLGTWPLSWMGIAIATLAALATATGFYALCEWVRRFGSDNRPPANRVYGIGRDRIEVIDLRPFEGCWPRIRRREVRIDTEAAIVRCPMADTTMYWIPTRQDREILQAIPQDPRVDAVLMRDPAEWGLHTIEYPRMSDRAAA